MKIHFSEPRTEKGVALLLALFALVLISAVGVAIVFMSTGETSMAANERANVTTWEAAKGGLKEMRSRMSPGDASYIGDANRPANRNEVFYILNPNGGGDPVVPTSTTNRYYDTEYASEWSVPITSAGLTVKTLPSDMQTLLAGGLLNAAPAYKWVRVTIKTEASSNQPVSCNPPSPCPLDATIPITYDAVSNRQLMAGMPNPPPTNMVYALTALAVLPNGTRRMAQYEVVYDNPVTIQAAINTKLLQQFGDALNVTGYADPSCNLKPLDGSDSGQGITVPGGGNILGAPKDISPNTTFPYNIFALAAKLAASSKPIDIPATNVTGSGSPKVFAGPHAILGTAPTVTYDGSGGVTAITSPGVPAILYSDGDLTLGTSTLAPPTVNGQGVLIVKGNLTIDISNGFNYFGLIVVTGDITMTTNPSTSASSNIHGAIIGGGKFISNLSNLSGSVFIHQNACMINSQFLRRPLTVISSREATQ